MDLSESARVDQRASGFDGNRRQRLDWSLNVYSRNGEQIGVAGTHPVGNE